MPLAFLGSRFYEIYHWIWSIGHLILPYSRLSIFLIGFIASFATLAAFLKAGSELVPSCFRVDHVQRTD
jgi:hypothetical protein